MSTKMTQTLEDSASTEACEKAGCVALKVEAKRYIYNVMVFRCSNDL